MNPARRMPPAAVLYAVFALVLLQLPAELPGSLIPGQWLVITALEASVGTLLAAILVWRWRSERGASRGSLGADGAATEFWQSTLRHLRRWREPGFWILAWLASQFAAALFAPELRGPAFKFAVRSAGIASLFWAALHLHSASPDPRWRIRNTMGWIVLVAAWISCIGAIEQARGDLLQPLLRPFRVVPSTVDGALRLTASFNHANQTASFLSMALPLAVGLALASRGAARWAWGVAAGAVLSGLFGTLSRAAIAAGILVAVLQLAVSVTSRPTRRAAIVGLVVVASLWALRWNLDAAFRQRIGARSTASGLAAEIEPPARLAAPSGTRLAAEVRIANRGYLSWPTRGVAPVRLAYHIFDATPAGGLNREVPPPGVSRLVGAAHADASTTPLPSLWVFDGVRTMLPRTVRPGESLRVTANVAVTMPPGSYVVAWDLVREGVAWFSQYDTAVAETHLDVTSAPAVGGTISPVREPVPAGSAWMQGAADHGSLAPRSVLWRTALATFAARPLLGAGPDTFRRTYGRSLGLERWDERVHANNFYLELLATTGLLGLLTWLGALATFVPSARAALRAAVAHADPIGLSLVGVVIVFSAHGLLDCFLGFYGSMGLFWIVAGLLLAWKRTPVEPGASPCPTASRR